MNKRSMAILGGVAALASVVVAGQVVAQGAAQPNGQALYEGRCASCHDEGEDRAPNRAGLAAMPASQIIAAMNGVMAPFAYGWTDGEKAAVASYLTAATPAAPQAAAPAPARGGAAPAAGAQPGRGGAGAPGAQAGRGGGRGAVQTTDTVCASNPPIRTTNSDWIGAGGTLTGHRYQPNPGIRAQDASRLKVKWSFSLTQGNSQPTVIGDWLWIAGSGRIYALDTNTGCVRWRADAITSRTTPVPVQSTASPSGWLLVVAQRNRVVKGLDAATGRELWASAVLEEHRSSGITGSPIVAGNQVFVPLTSGEEAVASTASYACCSFRGSLVALDLATGATQWKTSMIQEPMRPIRVTPAGTMLQGPAGAAIWSQPTADTKRGLIYVATGDSYTEADTIGADAIVAVDMRTGAIRWNTQVTKGDNFIMNCTRAGALSANCPQPLGPDYDFGASPILFDLPNGKQLVLSGQKSGIAHGMDPDTGEHLWSVRVGGGGALGGVEWGISADTQRLYAGSADIVSLFDEILRPLGRNTMANAPEPADPGLAAINPVTGRIVWRVPTPKKPCNIVSSRIPEGTCAAGNSGAPASMPGVVFAGDTAGFFRAYNAANGRILLEHNTAADTYRTTNGVAAQPGGGIDGAGPSIAQGKVFVVSGFSGASNYGSTPTGMNVLLAYSVDGR